MIALTRDVVMRRIFLYFLSYGLVFSSACQEQEVEDTERGSSENSSVGGDDEGEFGGSENNGVGNNGIQIAENNGFRSCAEDCDLTVECLSETSACNEEVLNFFDGVCDELCTLSLVFDASEPLSQQDCEAVRRALLEETYLRSWCGEGYEEEVDAAVVEVTDLCYAHCQRGETCGNGFRTEECIDSCGKIDERFGIFNDEESLMCLQSFEDFYLCVNATPCIEEEEEESEEDDESCVRKFEAIQQACSAFL